MMLYSLKALKQAASVAECEINGRWVPCRPVAWTGLMGFRSRLTSAWLVLIGKADAVVWPGGQ